MRYLVESQMAVIQKGNFARDAREVKRTYGEKVDLLPSLQPLRDANIHVSKVLLDIARGAPLRRHGEGIDFDLARMPDLDEGIFRGRVGGDVNERRTYELISIHTSTSSPTSQHQWETRTHTMMTKINNIIRIIPIIVMPVKRQIIPRHNLNRIPRLHIAHDIAPQIDRAEVLDGRVVSALAGCAIVCRDADAFEGSLVDAVDEDALGVLVGLGWEGEGVMWDERRGGEIYPDECVGGGLGGQEGERESEGARHVGGESE
jgi:hypothetical protein